MKMLDWAFARRGSGIAVIQGDEVIVLELNELLRRMASSAVGKNDVVVSSVMTNGRRIRVGDLKLFALVRTGALDTGKLPPRDNGGVLATGASALGRLRQIEEALPNRRQESEYLLRAARGGATPRPASELLRAAISRRLRPEATPGTTLAGGRKNPDNSEHVGPITG
jgi:hypothetical protein